MKDSKTVSFRVPVKIISEIEKEAKSKLVSTNVLINQILLEYVEFHRHRQRMRMLPIPADVMADMLKGSSEAAIKEMVDVTYASIHDWTLVTKMRFDFGTCLEVLEQYCRIGGIGFECAINSSFYSLVIRHELDDKFSLFASQLLEKIFWDLKKMRVDSEITPSTVMIKTRSRMD